MQEMGRRIEQINEDLEDSNPNKFQSYVLPGGKNYRELLLTLPERSDVVEPVAGHIDNFGSAGTPIWTVRDQSGHVLGQYGDDRAAAERHIAALAGGGHK